MLGSGDSSPSALLWKKQPTDGIRGGNEIGKPEYFRLWECKKDAGTAGNSATIISLQQHLSGKELEMRAAQFPSLQPII